MRVLTVNEREWKVLIRVLEIIPTFSFDDKYDKRARTTVMKKLKSARRAGEFVRR